MGLNPFEIQGGVVPRGTAQKPVVDNETALLYNSLMARYYEVGRDYKRGHVSAGTAEFH